MSDSPPKKAWPSAASHFLQRQTPPTWSHQGVGTTHQMMGLERRLSVDKKTVSTLIGWPTQGDTTAAPRPDCADRLGRAFTAFQHRAWGCWGRSRRRGTVEMCQRLRSGLSLRWKGRPLPVVLSFQKPLQECKAHILPQTQHLRRPSALCLLSPGPPL